MILDTQFLIDLEAEIREAQAGRARKFLGRHRSAAPLVTVISLGELAVGMNNNEAARIFLSRWRILNLNAQVALMAATVDREMIARGVRLGENDNWIAGFGRYYGTPVVSNDPAFRRVRGLRVHRY